MGSIHTTSVLNSSWLNTAVKKDRKIDVSYYTIAGAREHDIIERTQISLTSLTNLKISSQTTRGTSEGPETSVQKYLAMRIRLFWIQVCWDPIFTCFEK